MIAAFGPELEFTMTDQSADPYRAKDPAAPAPEDAGWAALPNANATPEWATPETPAPDQGLPPQAPGWQPQSQGWQQQAPGWPQQPPGWPPQSQGWPPQPPGWQPQSQGWQQQAPGWQPQAPGWPPGGQFGAGPYAPSTSSRPRILITLGVCLLVVAFAVAAVVVANRSENGTNGTTVLHPETGTTIFSDDFHDPTTGWTTTTTASGTTYAYTADGYVIEALGDNVAHLAYAPYGSTREKLSMSMTATLTGTTTQGAGMGVMCRRGSGDARLVYEFWVYADGGYSIERRDGAASASTMPRELVSGPGAQPAGTTPITVEGICATVDSETTRLVLYVNGIQISDITDTDYNMPNEAWLGGIGVLSVGTDGQSVTVTQFVERDLSK